MLKKVDPSNSMLMAYLQTINPSIKTGVLLPRSNEGSSKRSRRSKKVEVSHSKPVQEKKSTKSPKKKNNEEAVVSKQYDKPVEPESIEPVKEIVPSKTGVFKRIKKKAHKSHHSSEWSPNFSPSMV